MCGIVANVITVYKMVTYEIRVCGIVRKEFD